MGIHSCEDGFPVLFLRLLHILVSEAVPGCAVQVKSGNSGNSGRIMHPIMHGFPAPIWSTPQATVETSREPLVEPKAQDETGFPWPGKAVMRFNSVEFSVNFVK